MNVIITQKGRPGVTPPRDIADWSAKWRWFAKRLGG